MGSECSVEKDYELDEPVECNSKEWSIYTARRSQDGLKVTVFVHEKKGKEKNRDYERISKAAQCLKTLKHPAILRHHWSYDNSEEFCMVTEPVRPLESVIKSLDTMEIIAGLYNVVEALVFLHERGGLSHNNVCMSSVYVSDNDWGWRLGGMEHVCRFSELTNEFLSGTRAQRDTKSISPEEKDGRVNVSLKTGHALDAYGFGMFVSDILDTRTDLGDAGENFGEKMQSLFLHENPQMRPQFSSLLGDEFFRSGFLEIMTFLNQITIKTDVEKEKFFSSLAYKLTAIPPRLVAKRMLPRLMSRFVLADPSAEKNFLPHLLTPIKDGNDADYQSSNLSPVLPDELFREHCIPILMTLWSIRDGHVRMILLKYFGLYATSFEEEVLENFILPQFNSSESMPTISTNNVMKEKKISNIGPTNVSGVIDFENKLSPESDVTVQTSTRNTNDQIRNQEREKRRQEMEKRKDERKKEMERRRLEREKQRIAKQSSPKRFTDLVVPQGDPDQGEFEQWEELDESPSSPRSDVTSSRSSQATAEHGVNYWSDDQSVTSEQDKLEMNNVDVNISLQAGKSNEPSSLSRNKESYPSKSSAPTHSNALKLGSKKSSTKTEKSSKSRRRSEERLGSEFEITRIEVRSREPDYFADMEPSVTFKEKNSDVQPGKSQGAGLSSKLAMVEDTSQVESGWGDEWDGFD
ncbi:hypothetical protein pdam_00020965 [Pocillopora damicornis]|uniref:Protein kinase domain-containing protein n=1 Tax=Pocillopora damicornis TaxID=46731 RepID=A0A3M6TYZ6_POCDA|nr:hypothetical protein pdam_00020965 [Pocillopora damicornis]